MTSDIHDIVIGLLGNVLWAPITFVGGVVLTALSYFIRVRLPGRRLWRLTNPACLVVCAATSVTTDTGDYHRPATGIGQVRALTLAMLSLSRAYNRQVDIKNILFSTERLQERIENDLLLLGGPKNNQVTAQFLKLIGDVQPLLQTSDRIIWRMKQKAGVWIDDHAQEYISQVEHKQVVRDYGLIVRAQNPFTSSSRTIVLLSGGHTYGLVAAAKYFTEDLQRSAHGRKLLQKPNLVLLVSAHIIDEYPSQIALEQSYAW